MRYVSTSINTTNHIATGVKDIDRSHNHKNKPKESHGGSMLPSLNATQNWESK